MRTRLITGVLSSALLLVLAAPLSAADQNRPSFGGAWTIDHEASEDFREKMMQARSQGGGGPSGGRGSEGGGAGGGGQGSGSGSGSWGSGSNRSGGGGPSRGQGDGQDRRGRMQSMIQASEQLTIRHEGEELAIRAGDQPEQVLWTDGKKVDEDGPLGTPTETSARWKGDTVIVKRVNERMKTETRYELTSEGDLAVTTTFDSERMPEVSVRRLYRKAD